MNLSIENIISSPENITNVEIKKKIASAIEALDYPTKVPIITEAIKYIRKSRDSNMIKIAKDIALMAHERYPHNPYILGELCIVKLFLTETGDVIQLVNNFFSETKENNISIKDNERGYLTVTLAHAYSHEGQLGKGIKILEDLKSEAPNVLEALSELYYQNENHEETIKILGNRRSLTVKMARWLAKSYIKNGQIDLAQEILRKFDEHKQLKDVYNELFQERGVVSQKKDLLVSSDNDVSIFISHASKDKDLAKRLQRLLCDSLGCNKALIRCTSIAGSRIPVGSETPKQLANDILSAQIFIALLTDHSIKSDYVLFELGAAWIIDNLKDGHVTIPLLGNGVPYEILPGPFKQKNAVKADDISQIQQMLEEIAASLGMKLNDPSYYQDELSEFCGG